MDLDPATTQRFHPEYLKRLGKSAAIGVALILSDLAMMITNLGSMAPILTLIGGAVILYQIVKLAAVGIAGTADYAVDESGIWKGRRSDMTLIVPWDHVREWRAFTTTPAGNKSDSCTFLMENGALSIGHRAVASPSANEFEQQVRKNFAMEPITRQDSR